MAYHVFSSFLVFQVIFFYQFLCVWRIFFSHSFRICLLVTHSLSFPLSDNVLIFLSFLKDIFTRYSWLTVLLALKKVVPLLSCLYDFWWKIHCIWIGFPSRWGVISHYFQEFSLSSVFRILTMMCHGVDFFRFILFGIHSTAWICSLTYFTKFGGVSAIFEYLFSPTLYSPSGTPMIKMLDLLL